MERNGNSARRGNNNYSDHESITRRQFLKLSGMSAAGFVLLNHIPSLVDRGLATKQLPYPNELINQLLEIIDGSSVFQEVKKDLNHQGFGISARKDLIRYISQFDQYFGVVLKNSNTPSKRHGTNLVLTIDSYNNNLVMGQIVTGWSLLEMLSVYACHINASDPAYPRDIVSGHSAINTEMVHPRQEMFFSFMRSVIPELQEKDLIEVGWPDEVSDPRYWKYLGCSGFDWWNTGDFWMLRANEILEESFMDNTNQNRISLIYEPQ